MRTMRRRARWATWMVLGPLAAIGILLFIAAGGAIVWQLWNWLVPELFGGPRLGFWQALGLLALCRILFGGFGGSRRSGSRVGRRVERRIRRRLWERWERMSPEERDRFRERMRERWGSPRSAPDGDTGPGEKPL